MTSRLFLAAGAVLLLAGPALAFDRARLAEPGWRPCPSQGPGFARVPGSDACVRISGRVRAEAGAALPGRSGVAGRLAIDTRTETDYGPARAFVRVGTGRRW